jgi:hypothetical protein
MALSDVQKQELDRHNIGSKNFTATPEQMNIRKEIARRICEDNLSGCCKFYTNNHGMVFRMLGLTESGFIITVDEKLKIHITEMARLISIEEWDNSHLELIDQSENPELFLDPLGFIILGRLII